MTDDKAPKTDPKPAEHEASPKDELSAALAHLKSAADLIARRIDPAVRKAASEAEKAVERVASETEKTAHEIGAAAKPFASKVGAELNKLADEIKKSVAQLENAGAKSSEPPPKAPDPDDPGSLR